MLRKPHEMKADVPVGMTAFRTIRGITAGFDLFLISAAILFLELAAIRWFAAYVVTLSFFTNFVLLAAFLGMSVGCLASGRRGWLVYWPPLMHVVCLCTLLLYAATSYFFVATVDVQGGEAPEIVYFGTERVGEAALKPGIPLVALLAVLFLVLAGWFYPLGQIMGRCFDEIPDRVRAYTLNIGGSLAGIVLFSFCSFCSTPPIVWFAIVFAVVGYFLLRQGLFDVSRGTLLATTLLLIGLAGWRAPGYRFFWSPYYSIRFSEKTGDVVVNGISHQRMIESPWQLPAYRFPSVVYQAATGRVPGRVLVIGAGTGNDVAALLQAGAEHVDAIEIDPVIAWLGRKYHPDRPYDDPRVRLIIDDGRAFLRRTSEKYDLIVYGLVDSLTLQAGMANVRLETYLFTAEAFKEVRDRLREGGIFVVTNFFREGWIIHRIAGMAREAFGIEPVVVQFSGRRELPDTATRLPGIASVIASTSPHVASLFEDGLCLTCHRTHGRTDAFNCAGPVLRASELVATRSWELPTDNWPFLYLRDRGIPRHNLFNLLCVLAIGLSLVVAAAPERRMPLDPLFFCLGAGFMLIETKGVVELARVFGSTWLVNSLVFSGILVAILLANLLVLLVEPRRLEYWFGGLFLALALTWFVPLSLFAGLPFPLRAALVTALEFAPIFFAGVVFATLFRDTAAPSAAFGANIAGAVFGGACEYAALVLGYRNLVLIAALFYAVAALWPRRRK